MHLSKRSQCSIDDGGWTLCSAEAHRWRSVISAAIPTDDESDDESDVVLDDLADVTGYQHRLRSGGPAVLGTALPPRRSTVSG